MIAERSINDMAKGGDVKVPAKDISEPGFRYGPGGDWETVHPGNKEFVRGDKIPRPEGGGGGSGGSSPAQGESVDDFVFTLSRDEFLNIFFEDLELPNLMRTAIAEAEDKKLVRAGYVKEGTPSNLSVVAHHEDRAGAAHRAGRARSSDELEQRREELEAAARAGRPRTHIAVHRRRAILDLEGAWRVCPFLDDVDLRYRHRVAVPQPAAPRGHVLPDGRVRRPWTSARRISPSASSRCCTCSSPASTSASSWSSSATPTKPRRSTRTPSSTTRRAAARWCTPRWS